MNVKVRGFGYSLATVSGPRCDAYGTGIVVSATARRPGSSGLAIGWFLAFTTSMELLDRITIEAGKCGGKPCVRGYRIRVRDVLELLAQGASADEILRDHPFLEADDIRACLHFAEVQSDALVGRAS